MKALKYTIVIVLLALAIGFVVANYYRESLVRKAANAALGSLGMTATELSVDTIGTNVIRLSNLILEQDDGTRYEISGLTFPLSFPSDRAEQIAIVQLAVTPADSDSAPTPLAPLLRTLVQLPVSVPNTEVTVGRLTTPGFAPAEDVVWRTEGPRQQLTFRIPTIEVDISIDVNRMDQDAHRASVKAMADDNREALTLRLDVHSSDGGVAMTGDVTLSTSPWLPLLESAGLLPPEVVALDAELTGPIAIELHDDEPPSSSAGVRLSLADEFSAEYRAADDLDGRLTGTWPEPLAVTLEYPSLEWTAGVGRADVRIGTASISDIPVRLDELECRAGIHCAARVSIDTGPVELGTATVANAKLAAPLTVTVEEATRVDVAPDSRLTLSGVELPALSVASVATTQLAGARLVADADGWSIDVDRLDLQIDAATDGESLLASGPLELTTVQVRDNGTAADAAVAIQPRAAKVSWGDTAITVPGVAGNLSLRDGRVAASVELADDDALSARIDASHDIAKGAGAIAVRGATLRFDAGPLSERLERWPYAWDVVAGNWAAEVELQWQTAADGTEYDGTMTHRADALAGRYEDTAFAGLSTTLSATLDSKTGIAVTPASLEMELIDIGVPLEQIAADYALDVEQQAVQLSNLSLNTLGGRITADPFRFGLNEPRNDITLRPQSIQLPFIMNLVEFGDIELTGSISGVIPVTINDMNLTISNGQLQSDPPGGVIRYLPGVELVETGTSESTLDIASRALANFQFDSLTAVVEYPESGEMKLQMKLSGANPDWKGGQPVVLNLDVENNVPQMLRSLRATRTIEEALAK